MHYAAAAQPATARLSWLSDPTVLLCIGGVVLPNVLSLGAFAAGLGSPPRTTAIALYAAIALVARLASPLVVIALYLLATALECISTVAKIFNLTSEEIGTALRFGTQLNLFESPLYAVLCIAAAALLGANLAFLTMKRETLRRGNPLVMTALAFAVAAIDLVANTSAHYQFGSLYGRTKPMTSAMDSSGFRQTALGGEPRRVLVVIVEALGALDDPRMQALLLEPLKDPTLSERYEVTTGTTTYYGSTTSAEMRELCNTRRSYKDLLDGEHYDCLPEAMKARGYRSVAYHNFTGTFFDRNQWYPKIGFDKRAFGEDVIDSVDRLCGGPFRGPCDTEMLPFIAKELRDATDPTFVYWLTLSTHVPVGRQEGAPRLGCKEDGGPLGHVEVCYMTEMWMDVFEGIAAMTAEIPPTEILIVGDHGPPLWSKAGRNLFTPGQVTWARLKPRSGDARSVELRPTIH